MQYTYIQIKKMVQSSPIILFSILLHFSKLLRLQVSASHEKNVIILIWKHIKTLWKQMKTK